MKSLLTALFVCIALSLTQAQFRPAPQPPTVTYRQGNFNQFNLLLTRAGVTLTPTSSLTISGEVRMSDEGRVMYVFPFSIGDTLSGSLKATLPPLQTGIYQIGILLKYAGEPEFRAGIAKVNIVPTGQYWGLLT